MKFLRFMLALVLVFALALPASAMTGNKNEPAHYVSMGDSLAAGILYDRSFGKGYSDWIAEWLKDDQLLASYNNDFAVPKLKTDDLLKLLNEDKTSPLPTAKEKLTISETIKNADVITISIGANDILEQVKYDPAAGTLQYELASIFGAITTTGNNVAAILKKIHEINPTVDVFVMGIYNPFPSLESYKPVVSTLVTSVDNALKNAAEANKSYFVSVNSTIDKDALKFIPSKTDIHPNEEGYKAIAETFYKPVKEYIQLMPLPEVIDPKPTTPLPKFKDIKSTETAMFAGKAAQYGIMKGYPDGTFKPNTNLTRMQATTMIVRTLSLTNKKAVPYTDVAKLSAESKDIIEKAYAAGIIPDGKTFNANKKITRLEVARMIDAAYATVMGHPYRPDDIAPFTDISKLSAEDKKIVTLLYDFEISTGSGGKFMPTSTLTRSQAAKMFVVLKEKL